MMHWNLVSEPCSETGPNLRALLFVDRLLQITKLCTEVNISVLKQYKSTLKVLGEEISESGNGISTIGKRKFTILQNGMVSLLNESSPFCRTEWLYYYY